METLFVVAFFIWAFGMFSGRIDKSIITAPMVFVAFGLLVGRWNAVGKGASVFGCELLDLS